MTVEELLQKNNIFYKYAGKDVLVSCLNPEHPDRNPSMRIDRLSGLFNCLSCSFKGNIYAHFDETVDINNLMVLKIKDKISNIMQTEFTLPLGTEPFRRKFRGISAETYQEFSAFLHSDYEDRIVFPIHDITGKLKGIIGRKTFSDAGSKYLIKPSGKALPLFPPQVEPYKDSVIVVEGIFDLLNLYDKGLKNVVCTFGKQLGDVKNLQKKEINLNKFLPLKIQGIKKLFILYDTGAEKSSDNLAELVSSLFLAESVKFPLFNQDKDAGNLTQEEVNKLKEFIYDKDCDSR